MASNSKEPEQSDFWHRNLTTIPKFTNSFIEKFAEENLPIKATVTRGYKFFHEEYVHEIEVKLCKNDHGTIVRAKCFRSMKKNEEPHKLSIVFDPNVNITNIIKYQCSCAAGQGLCHHVLGLLFTLTHYQMLGLKSVPPLTSKTSKPQTWNVPSRKEGIKPRPVTEVVIQKSKLNPKPPKKKRKISGVTSTVYKPFQMPLNRLDLPTILVTQFSDMDPKPGFLRIWPDGGEEPAASVDTAFGEVPKGCVISYQQPPKVKADPDVVLPDFDFPQLYYLSTVLGEREDLFFTALIVGKDQSIEFEKATREQSSTKEWHDLRKFRITSSKFKNVCSRQKDFESLSIRFLKGKTNQTESMKYGIQNEGVAAEYYSKQFGKETYKVGFLINPSQPHLGCSPDRRVFDDTESHPWGLLEIKCSMADRLHNLKYLKFNGISGKYALRKVHAYYYQVMGCLGLTGSHWCDFFVYCQKEFHCERVYFDAHFFSEMFDKLNLFYFNYHLSSCVE